MGSAPARQRATTRPRRRAVARALLLGGLALILCAGVAISLYGRELSAGLVRAAFGYLGVEPDEIEIRSVGLSGLAVGSVRLPGGPSASAIDIEWSPRSLMHGRLTRVRIAGLTAELDVDEGGIAIRGLPGNGGSSDLSGLPFERLELADARLAIATDAATIDTTIDATAMAAERGMAGQAALHMVAAPRSGQSIRVTAQLPEWRLTQDSGRLQLTLARAVLLVPEYGLSASGIEARLDIAGSASLRLAADLEDTSVPARFAPLALTAQAQRDGGMLVASGRIAAERGLVATFNGRHDPAGGGASVDFETGPIVFRPDGLQPGDLVPIAGQQVRHVAGTVTARGALSWRDALTSRLTVKLEDFGFDSGVAKFGDIQAALTLNSVMPPRTPGPQRITGMLQVVGLPAAPLDLSLSLPGDDRLIVNAATLGFAGGTMGVSNLALTAGGPIQTAIEIRTVDLGAMLDLIGISGLSGSGTIGGRIPVRMDADGVAITSGRLASTGTGVVRYTGAGLPDGGGADGDAVRLLREALADFRYTDLALTLDRGASGEGSVLVNLKGANPAVLDNHPFAINIRLEADFDRLASVLFDGYAAAAGVLRRMKPP